MARTSKKITMQALFDNFQWVFKNNRALIVAWNIID